MNRKIYESPSTIRYGVALEGNFAGSADVKNPNTETGRIDNQNINTDFGTDITFGDSWE